MIKTFSRTASPLILAGALALGGALAKPAQADELRIGFIAPMTGIFAQVGKDMVNGFQMYLDDHKGKLGGMDVKFIVEDNQGKGDAAVTKAKKLVLRDKVHMFIGGVLGFHRLRACPGFHSREDDLHRFDPGGRRSHATPGQQVSLFPAHRLVVLAANPSDGAMGLRPGLQEDRHRRGRLRLRLRAGRRLPEGLRGLRRQDHSEDLAAARHQGFRPLHPDHQGRRRRRLHADGRPDVAAIPQAVPPIRQQEADRRRRHQL